MQQANNCVTVTYFWPTQYTSNGNVICVHAISRQTAKLAQQTGVPKGIKGFIPPKWPKLDLTDDAEYVANLVNVNIWSEIMRQCSLLWPLCIADADIIFLPCDFYISSFFYLLFPCLISAVGDWISSILPRMVWP